MAALSNQINAAALNEALNEEFIANFTHEYDRLAEFLGIFSPEVMAAGQVLEQVKVTGQLNDTAESDGSASSGAAYVEGDLVALSKYETEKVPVGTVGIMPYRKQTTAAAILKAGYDIAVLRTDRKMLSNVRVAIMNRFFAFLANGTGTPDADAEITGLQSALAFADAALDDALEENGDQSERKLHFVNRQDIAKYLADAKVTSQSAFGITYLESFLGVNHLFVSGQIPKGTVYTTMAENLHVYGVDFATLGQAGLSYATESNGLIGVAHNPVYERMGVETHVASGMLLFPEVKDYIVKATIGSGKAPEGTAAEKSVDEMTVDELKAYAAAHSIDITGKTAKADILAAIKAAS